MANYLKATFGSLATRNFRLFFIGQGISSTGSWMQRMAVSLLALDLTDSGTWLGIVVGAQLTPVLLFSPWSGLLADRYPKRKMLMIAAAAGIVPASLLFIFSFTGWISVLGVTILSVMAGTVDALEKTSRQSFPSEMVKPELLANAVTLNYVVTDVGKAAGPAIAAVLITVIGLPFTFLVNALSFLVIFAVLWLMRPAELSSPVPIKSEKGQFRNGLIYVKQHPTLLGPLALLTAAGLVAYNFQVMLPLLAEKTFNGDATTVGLLLTSFGLGSIFGGLAFSGVLRPSPRYIVGFAFILAVFCASTGLAPSVTSAVVLAALFGVSSVLFKTITSSWLQLTAIPTMRGRVISLLVISLAGTSPIGAPLIGWISTQFGTRTSFVFAGVVTAIAATLTLIYLHRKGQLGSKTQR